MNKPEREFKICRSSVSVTYVDLVQIIAPFILHIKLVKATSDKTSRDIGWLMKEK